jgi:sortase A
MKLNRGLAWDPIRLLGNVALVAGLGGFAFVVTAPRLPPAVIEPVASVFVEPQTLLAAPRSPSVEEVASIPSAESSSPITRLVIPSIGLDTQVVPAPLVDHDGSRTWDVPKFVGGHAEGTAGAGESGNAVVMGHVTSLTLGHVFEHLNEVAVGDRVTVYSDDRSFVYDVTGANDVDRTDVDVLDPTPTPTLTLITCSGLWLPTVRDYNERFVVRAELRQAD